MHLYLYDVAEMIITKDVHDITDTHVISIRAVSEGNDAVLTLLFEKENKDAWDVIAQHVPNPPEWDVEQDDD